MALPLIGGRRLTRRVYAPGSWNSTGRYVNGAATDTTIYASFQPISTALQRERGGERRRATHTVYTRTPLQVSLPDGGPLAMRVVVPTGPDAGTYEVEAVQPYDAWAPVPHYEADCYLYNEPNPTPANLETQVAEILLQTCRGLIKASGNLTDAQVVVQEDKAPRPPLPYIAVLIDTSDTMVQATDSQAFTWSDTVTVTGGTEGDVYTIDAAGVSVAYTRTDTDTDTTVAAALASALVATGRVASVATGAALTLIAFTGALDTEATGPLTVTPRAAPATVQRGLRTARLALTGYGTGAKDLLQEYRAYAASPAGLDAQIAGGTAVQPAGDIVTASVDLGTAYEPRYECSDLLSYVLSAAAQTGLEARQILVAGTVSSSDGLPGLPFQVNVEP